MKERIERLKGFLITMASMSSILAIGSLHYYKYITLNFFFYVVLWGISFGVTLWGIGKIVIPLDEKNKNNYEEDLK